ncbi:MAG: DUF1178 family protein [Thermodesulfobacteriota bacterium]
MITFDLACDKAHRFEGWFRSARDFDDQKAAGLLECPLCGSRAVTKQLSPVAVHVGRRTAPERANSLPARGDAGGPPEASGPSGAAPPGRAPVSPRPEAFFRVLARFVETHFEDVGPAFAQEARKIEAGEGEVRNIRGTTTAAEEEALREDGIEFLTLALPKYDA